MSNVVAFANNDVATIAWSYDKKPEGCMGFAIYRIDNHGVETALPSHAVFPGGTIAPGQTTADYPVQKFYWKDVYARPIGDTTHNYTFTYKVVPLEGAPGALVPSKTLETLTSKPVTISGVCSPSLTAIFNRGLLSTQHVAAALHGTANQGSLKSMIEVPTNQLRKDLAGDMTGTLTTFLLRAKHSGTIYASLYELTDPELVPALVAAGKALNIILSNIVEPPKGDKPAGPGENDPAETQLKASAASLLYRQPPTGHIVHNKFLVYVDDHKVPQAVLTGSCNWTDTGLCAQTNNAIVLDDKTVAARYLEYWHTLQADEVAHEAGKPFQDTPLRTYNGKAVQLTVDKGKQAAAVTSYFSPNTPKQRGTNKANEAFPVDMKDLHDRILAAKHAVLFLAFIPGTPGIVEFAADAQKANADLFVRGCLTSPDDAGNFVYDLKGTSPPKKTPGAAPAPEDARVIAANALDKANIPAGWSKELLSAGFAIIHDKIVVIDPFADDCVVVTGSHNLGYEASYNNDENLLMIQGNRKLAEAYATHVLDVYDHFAWRFAQNSATPTDANLATTSDQWLAWYFDAQGNITTAQLKFWMQACT